MHRRNVQHVTLHRVGSYSPHTPWARLCCFTHKIYRFRANRNFKICDTRQKTSETSRRCIAKHFELKLWSSKWSKVVDLITLTFTENSKLEYQTTFNPSMINQTSQVKFFFKTISKGSPHPSEAVAESSAAWIIKVHQLTIKNTNRLQFSLWHVARRLWQYEVMNRQAIIYASKLGLSSRPTCATLCHAAGLKLEKWGNDVFSFILCWGLCLVRSHESCSKMPPKTSIRSSSMWLNPRTCLY